MKNLSLTLCLGIAALLGGVGIGSAKDPLPKCPETGYLSNCVAEFSTKNGGKWIGIVNDGILIADSSKGNQYIGGFKDNKFNGQGTYTWFDGEKYDGEIKDGKNNGQGTYTFVNGDQYIGGFKDHKFDGYGTYTHADGTVEEGIWKDGKFFGN